MGGVLGKILFEGIGSTDGNPGKTVLSGPASSQNKNPGDVELTESPVSKGEAGGKVNLISPPIKDSSATSIELIEPAKPEGELGSANLANNGGTLEGRRESINLESAPIISKIDNNVNLESPPKTELSGAPKVGLTSPESGPTERPSNVELESPTQKDRELGNVQLE
jgi:hypothetical protein